MTNIRTYLVGGAVRDRLLGLEVTERDWVVVGATADHMRAQGFRPVGQDFPVFLDPVTGEEHALARTERKSGRGYGGFVFHASPEVTLEEDLRRRDLTVNAMAQTEEGLIIDPYGGQRDLAARLLRHVSPAFAEDPLRVLRVARFAARYADLGFEIAPETLDLMRALSTSGELRALTAERCWKEISRALMEARPAVFFEVLKRCGALAELFPPLERLYRQPGPSAAFADLASFQLSVLSQAAEAKLPLAARWACLLQGFSALEADEGQNLVQELNARYRVPRDCSELAQLCCVYLPAYQTARQLSAETLCGLFKSLDIYRRPERFELYLATCEADHQVRHAAATASPSGFLRGAAAIVRGVPVQPLLARGLTGSMLGETLEGARQAALEEYCAAADLP